MNSVTINGTGLASKNSSFGRSENRPLDITSIHKNIDLAKFYSAYVYKDNLKNENNLKQFNGIFNLENALLNNYSGNKAYTTIYLIDSSIGYTGQIISVIDEDENDNPIILVISSNSTENVTLSKYKKIMYNNTEAYIKKIVGDKVYYSKTNLDSTQPIYCHNTSTGGITKIYFDGGKMSETSTTDFNVSNITSTEDITIPDFTMPIGSGSSAGGSNSGSSGGTGTTYSAGDGLSLDSNKFSVNLGAGLKFDNSKKLTLNIGDGLELDGNGVLKATGGGSGGSSGGTGTTYTAGTGIDIANNTINIKYGSGLELDESGNLIVTATPVEMGNLPLTAGQNNSITGVKISKESISEILGSDLAALFVSVANPVASGHNSIALGGNSYAYGHGSFASGYNIIAGAKGYYFSNINFTKGSMTITLSGTTNPNWKAGDRLSIKNGDTYVCACTLKTNSTSNVISVTDLPFSEIVNSSSLLSKLNKLVVNIDQPDKGTVVSGFGSIAFGGGKDNKTRSIGSMSTAIGYENIAAGSFSFAAGKRTIAGDTAFATGSDTQAIGENSSSFGLYTEARGIASHAEGNTTIAVEEASHAEGKSTSAKGIASHAEGSDTEAYNSYSHSEGNWTYAKGNASHAEGTGYIEKDANGNTTPYRTTAEGNASHAEGYYTLAQKDFSHSEGYKTRANGTASHAEGRETSVQKEYGHSEGYETHATGYASHVEGYGTIAGNTNIKPKSNSSTEFGIGSHAEGVGTLAKGGASHAEGSSTSAIGYASHAEGSNTNTFGVSSYASGGGTTAGIDGDRSLKIISKRDNVDVLGVSVTTLELSLKYKDFQSIFGFYPYEFDNDSLNENFAFKIRFKEDIVNVYDIDILRIYSTETVVAGSENINTGNVLICVKKGKLDPYSIIEDNSSELAYKDVGILTFSDDITIKKSLNGPTLGAFAHSEGLYTKAKELGSHAEGRNTIASNISSHAEGESSHAEGRGTHAEGGYTTASGRYAHAEGDQTMATGNGAHAEGGNLSLATGEYSHAEGSDTNAFGDYSHAEGEGSHAEGESSHAEGRGTHAEGNGTHAEGSGTIANGNYSHAEGELTYAFKNIGSDSWLYNRRINIYGTSKFKLDGKTKGQAAHSEGQNTTAFGERSHTEGNTTFARGDDSHAEGGYTTAIGNNSHAEGYGTWAFSAYSHTEGKDTIADKTAAHAEGNMTYAAGAGSHAEGYHLLVAGVSSEILIPSNTDTNVILKNLSDNNYYKVTAALGTGSHAEGRATLAEKEFSHAEGDRCRARGMQSHAEGKNTDAKGASSHAEGENTTATGNCSHAGGNGSNSIGTNSFAHGDLCLATGTCSIALGKGAKTTANYAVSIGRKNTSQGLDSVTIGTSLTANKNQFVIGKYNSELLEQSSYIDGIYETPFIIGYGTSSRHKNILVVDNRGSISTSNAAGITELYEWEDGNPNNDDRRGYFITVSKNKIRIATPNDKYILGAIDPHPSMIMDTGALNWHDKYLRDEFGSYIYENVELPAEYDEDGNLIEEARIERRNVLNPDYDPTKEYVPRQNRQEFAAITSKGRVILRDDGTCRDDAFATVGEGGIATHSDDNVAVKVLERIDDSHILVYIDSVFINK